VCCDYYVGCASGLDDFTGAAAQARKPGLRLATHHRRSCFVLALFYWQPRQGEPQNRAGITNQPSHGGRRFTESGPTGLTEEAPGRGRKPRISSGRAKQSWRRLCTPSPRPLPTGVCDRWPRRKALVRQRCSGAGTCRGWNRIARGVLSFRVINTVRREVDRCSRALFESAGQGP
jgi:hypothetical protein